jgi:hypothetical protein
MHYDLNPWMSSWGWIVTDAGFWEKRSASGLIIAFQGDNTWQDDYNRATEYERQLIGATAN